MSALSVPEKATLPWRGPLLELRQEGTSYSSGRRRYVGSRRVRRTEIDSNALMTFLQYYLCLFACRPRFDARVLMLSSVESLQEAVNDDYCSGCLFHALGSEEPETPCIPQTCRGRRDNVTSWPENGDVIDRI